MKKAIICIGAVAVLIVFICLPFEILSFLISKYYSYSDVNPTVLTTVLTVHLDFLFFMLCRTILSLWKSKYRID